MASTDREQLLTRQRHSRKWPCFDLPEAAALVRARLGLGLGLGLTVTAAGAEQTVQATAHLGDGCQQAQGFLYSTAVSAAEALRIVTPRGNNIRFIGIRCLMKRRRVRF
jgi:EAL domain-containing protein (putative c-di-GMP-specific phosphodiesterase class I)